MEERRKRQGSREDPDPVIRPRVSIIMTTFNSIAHVEQTLKSVLSQDYPDLEVVIADGGSTDGTVDVIRRYAGTTNRNSFPEPVYSSPEENQCRKRLVWVSGPDRGIYDGMNKAIRMSTGDVIGVCNDLFTRTDAVSLIVSAIQEAEEQVKECGKAFRISPVTGKAFPNDQSHENNRIQIIGAHADLAYMDGDRVVRKWVMGEGRIEDGWLPAHPTMYLKREVYEKYGLYDLRFQSSSDYEFMVRVLKHPENRLVYVPVELIHMFYGGTSNAGFRGYLRNTREAYEALKENEIPHPGCVIAKRILRTLRQFR